MIQTDIKWHQACLWIKSCSSSATAKAPHSAIILGSSKREGLPHHKVERKQRLEVKTSPLQDWFKLIHTHNVLPLLTRQLQSPLTSGLWHRHSCVGSWWPSIHKRWRGQTFAWKSCKICNFEFPMLVLRQGYPPKKKRLACLLQKSTFTYAWLRGRSYWPLGKHGRSILLGWKLHLFRPSIHWDPEGLALPVLEPGCPPCPPDLRHSYVVCTFFILYLFCLDLRLPFYILFSLLWSCMLG